MIMSTHYMEEAEALADRVAIIDHGRIVAVDTPGRLIDTSGPEPPSGSRHTSRSTRPPLLRYPPSPQPRSKTVAHPPMCWQ